MSNREIEKNEALARIKGLENELANGWQRDRIKALEDRIEQLEAALRQVIDDIQRSEGVNHLYEKSAAIVAIARAALTPGDWTAEPLYAAPQSTSNAYQPMEICPTCAGSGYSNHPDSGEVCYQCNGSGGVAPPEETP